MLIKIILQTTALIAIADAAKNLWGGELDLSDDLPMLNCRCKFSQSQELRLKQIKRGNVFYSVHLNCNQIIGSSFNEQKWKTTQ